MCWLVTASALLTDGLQSYWAFDGAGEDYQDSGPYGLDMQELAGSEASITTTGVDALVGKSAEVSADGAYMRSINNMGSMNITDEVTVSFWYRGSNVNTSNNAHLPQGRIFIPGFQRLQIRRPEKPIHDYVRHPRQSVHWVA